MKTEFFTESLLQPTSTADSNNRPRCKSTPNPPPTVARPGQKSPPPPSDPSLSSPLPSTAPPPSPRTVRQPKQPPTPTTRKETLPTTKKNTEKKNNEQNTEKKNTNDHHDNTNNDNTTTESINNEPNQINTTDEQTTDKGTQGTKETQPTNNKTPTSDNDSTTKPNDNEKGTPTTNPYRKLKVAKRPQSPEPSFLFHLHVAVNHHHNHEIESTLLRLTEQALKTHLNDVFFHHSKREEPMWLQVHSVDFLETKQSPSRPLRGADNQNRSNKGSGHTSTFHVTLSPAPANDAFDTGVFFKQGLRFVLQVWHKHHNDDFSYDEHGSQTILRPGTRQSNPTIYPRYDQINVYQPACNNRTSDTYSIVVGVLAQTIKHRRAALDLSSDIQNILTPHLPRKLNHVDYYNHIGCRAGTFSGELKNKQRGQVPAIYITASSKSNFEALLRSYNAYLSANRNTELAWCKNNIQIIPMPTSQSNRTTTLEAIKDIDQFFGACVKIKLKPINQEATDGDWKRLRNLREFVALFPEFDNEDPDPQFAPSQTQQARRDVRRQQQQQQQQPKYTDKHQPTGQQTKRRGHASNRRRRK